MNYLIDTNVLIEIENNNDVIIQKIRKIDPQKICISFFTFCEFFTGARHKSENNQLKVLERLRQYEIINTTEKSGLLFCRILHELTENGTLIPTFAVFIAAMAIEHSMTLLTLDNHFKRINSLSCEQL